VPKAVLKNTWIRGFLSGTIIVGGIFFFYSNALATSGCTLSLSFTTTAGNTQAASGAMDYLLTATNKGTVACKEASISVYYTRNESFVSATPKATEDGHYWQLGSLAPSQNIDIALATARSAPIAAGYSTDEACLSADNGADSCAFSQRSTAVSANSVPAAPVPASASATPTTSALTAPLVIAATTTQITPSIAPASAVQERGVWVWNTLGQLSDAKIQQIVNEAAAGNFNVIYLTIEALPAGAATGKIE
jgi:hypothetical protein